MKELICAVEKCSFNEYDEIKCYFSPNAMCPNGLNMKLWTYDKYGEAPYDLGELSIKITVDLNFLTMKYENRYRDGYALLTNNNPDTQNIKECNPKFHLDKFYERVKKNNIRFTVDNKKMYVLTWDEINSNTFFGFGNGTKDKPDIFILYS